MPENSPEQRLLTAVAAFTRRLVLVSPDYRVLAALHPNGPPEPFEEDTLCHRFYYDLDQPCPDCPVPTIVRTGRPAFRDLSGRRHTALVGERTFIPVFSGSEVEAIAALDIEAEYFDRLQSEVLNAHAFLESMIMSSADGIIASDMEGRILIFNEAAAQITGYRAVEAMTELHIAEIYPEGVARRVMNRLRSELDGPGKLKNFRVDLKRKDGRLTPIELSASIVHHGSAAVATVGFFRDLTDRLRLERELSQTQVQLMQAEKMGALGKLAAGVAHQLNNPLTAIALFNRILTDEYDLPEAARKDLARVAEAVDRCQKTVTELLHFARQSAMNFCHNDINRAIDRTMFLLENQPLFTEIEIGRHFDPDLPPVYADVQQLGHVFMNVILNAAEAMNGQGRLDLYTRSLENGDRVQVEIADTGPGILTEVAPHIFEPFFTTKGDGRGTGLGLSVAYGVIESHQGRISVKNREPGGARFIIELPTQPPTET